jgi:hypothetical protein
MTPTPAGAVTEKLWVYLLLATSTVTCLIPFSGRAFHVDDTLFVWAAKQIAQHPLNPYGFPIVWESQRQLMSDVTQPLSSYQARELAVFDRISVVEFAPRTQ